MANTNSEHIANARKIFEIAKAAGATAYSIKVQEAQFVIAAKPDAIDLRFWRGVLAYQPMLDDAGINPNEKNRILFFSRDPRVFFKSIPRETIDRVFDPRKKAIQLLVCRTFR